MLPKRISHKTSAVFYVDTSGSISDEMLNKALTEVRGALRSNAADLFVSFVDAKIHSCTKVRTLGQVKLLKPQGGGGTDMRLCFEHYKKLRQKVNLIVVLTDGYTPWPDEAPHGVHTIVVLTQSEGGTSPEWAKTVRIGARR